MSEHECPGCGADARFCCLYDPQGPVQTLTAERDALRAQVTESEARHRDLVSRLGFGDNITEPMADNDTVVKWYDDRNDEASEWVESQMWRQDCYLKGHPELEDCFECDPSLRLERAEAQVERVRALDSILSKVVEMYRHLAMDTPEDQALHARVIEQSDNALRLLRDALDGPA